MKCDVTWARGVARSVKLLGEAWTTNTDETRATMAERLKSIVRERDVGGSQRRNEADLSNLTRCYLNSERSLKHSRYWNIETVLVAPRRRHVIREPKQGSPRLRNIS